MEYELDNLEIDLDDLTIREVEMVEDIIDAPIDSLAGADVRKGKVLRAMAFVAARRIYPDIKVGDLDDVKMSILGGDEEVDPT